MVSMFLSSRTFIEIVEMVLGAIEHNQWLLAVFLFFVERLLSISDCR